MLIFGQNFFNETQKQKKEQNVVSSCLGAHSKRASRICNLGRVRRWISSVGPRVFVFDLLVHCRLHRHPVDFDFSRDATTTSGDLPLWNRMWVDLGFLLDVDLDLVLFATPFYNDLCHDLLSHGLGPTALSSICHSCTSKDPEAIVEHVLSFFEILFTITRKNIDN